MKRRRTPPPRQIREPVQVYLDPRDKALLETLAQRTSLSQAELLRRGLHRLSAELLPEARPGASLDQLIGALDGVSDLPNDLAARHDQYLYPPEDSGRAGGD